MLPCKILLVDNDQLILSTLAQRLRNVGYHVFEATSGKAAIAIAEKTEPEIAIVGIRMPGMVGVEVGQWLRKQGIPFLFLSAYTDDKVVAVAVEEGAFGYLVKPVDVSQLLPVIQIARQRAAEIKKLKETEAQLSIALSGSREISVAIGLLMERHCLLKQEAFECLRAQARKRQCKLRQLAGEIVNAAEQMNSLREIGL
jgi:two-component system, response regulator PdtaR